jgi:hypothetical protein
MLKTPLRRPFDPSPERDTAVRPRPSLRMPRLRLGPPRPPDRDPEGAQTPTRRQAQLICQSACTRPVSAHRRSPQTALEVSGPTPAARERCPFRAGWPDSHYCRREAIDWLRPNNFLASADPSVTYYACVHEAPESTGRPPRCSRSGPDGRIYAAAAKAVPSDKARRIVPRPAAFSRPSAFEAVDCLL